MIMNMNMIMIVRVNMIVKMRIKMIMTVKPNPTERKNIAYS